MILSSKLNYSYATILLFALISISYGFPVDKQLNINWEAYKKEYGKSYENSLEESMRMQVFALNMERIDKFNLNQSKLTSFKQGLNHFSDRTDDEYKQLSNLRIPEFSNDRLNDIKVEKFFSKLSTINNNNDDDLPKTVDWRKVPGRVSRVKSQGDCASSWAFAATGALEGQMIRRGLKNLTALSEQDLIDCSEQNGKCSGGFYGYAFDDIKQLGGIQDEQSYPYTGSDKSACLFQTNKAVFNDDGYIMLPKKDEAKLKLVVAKYGPVAAAVNPSLDSFRNYKSGVYKDDDCSDNNQDITLAVLIVGYGTDEKDGDYWLIKNAWSENWGEKGYMRIARNSDDMCGIALIPAVPDFL